ncbi:response regulator [Dactylosporangium sp. CA-092794]|uniref:response regulator n=1 Tax=Dactylosporangium sp. CA-092794 TaxID=3239929 RepID=UPI003D91ABA2
MRVVIAEDHVLLADGLARLLAAYRHIVVATVHTGPDLITAVNTHRPDVAVVDIRLPPTFTDEGLAAAVTLRRTVGAPVLILSQYVETAYARDLLTAGGATGYLLKDRIARPREFVDALSTVAAGGTVLDPEAVTQMFARDRTRRALASLSDRERQVLHLMAQGRSNAAIAQAIVVTEATVEKHIKAIFTKLDLPPSGDDHRRVRAVLAYLDG